jgi:hypothetical protein
MQGTNIARSCARVCLFLAACSTSSSQTERLVAAAPTPAAPTTEERLSEAKTIIEAESASFFDPSAKARDIAISAVRDVETPIGIRSGVCLRATLTNRMGREMGARIYLVTFDKGRILPASDCRTSAWLRGSEI